MTRLWGIEQTDVLEHFVGEDGEEGVGVDEEEVAVLVGGLVLCLYTGRCVALTVFAVLLKVSSQAPISLSIPSS